MKTRSARGPLQEEVGVEVPLKSPEALELTRSRFDRTSVGISSACQRDAWTCGKSPEYARGVRSCALGYKLHFGQGLGARSGLR